MSVTFVDNHDTGPSPGGGQNHWPFPGSRGGAGVRVHPHASGHAHRLLPHYLDRGTALRDKIRALIQIRRRRGITSTSTISMP